MTQQTKLALTGIAGVAVAKFLLHKEWKMAGLIGMATIAAVALFEARNVPDNA